VNGTALEYKLFSNGFYKYIMNTKVKMKIYIIITVQLILYSLTFSEPSYSSYWLANGYSTETAALMGKTQSGEILTQQLQKSDSPETIFEMGRLYYARGLYRQALSFFRKTDFGGDLRLLYIGLCNIVLNEPDSAKTALVKITDARIRAWSSAGLARISNTTPTAANDFPYLTNFFLTGSEETEQSKKGYTLQFGAFADSTRAQKMVEILKDIGLTPYTTRIDVGERILFRVRAESFPTKEEAQQAGAALGDQFIFMVVPEE